MVDPITPLGDASHYIASATGVSYETSVNMIFTMANKRQNQKLARRMIYAVEDTTS